MYRTFAIIAYQDMIAHDSHVGTHISETRIGTIIYI